MKKLLYTLIAVSIIIAACKKEDENINNSTGTSIGTIAELEEIIQGGEAIRSWQVIEMTQQHREGYFDSNGEKIYTDLGSLPEIDTITIEDNAIFTFYDSGDSVSVSCSSGEFMGAFDFSDEMIYQVTGANQVEFFGGTFGPYQIYTIWEISNKTNTSIETYYDDFWPIPSSSGVDSFSCDQGNLILERVQ